MSVAAKAARLVHDRAVDAELQRHVTELQEEEHARAVRGQRTFPHHMHCAQCDAARAEEKAAAAAPAPTTATFLPSRALGDLFRPAAMQRRQQRLQRRGLRARITGRILANEAATLALARHADEGAGGGGKGGALASSAPLGCMLIPTTNQLVGADGSVVGVQEADVMVCAPGVGGSSTWTAAAASAAATRLDVSARLGLEDLA